MGKIKDLRDALIADLADSVGIPVMDDWLVRAEPPCILVTTPGADYVHAGKELRSYVLSADVAVLVQVGPDARDQSDALLEAVLRNTADWGLVGVDPPRADSIEDSTVEFLSTVVHLEKGFYL